MSENFYVEKIAEIKKHIDTNQLVDALRVLTEELKMPYIPKIYEEEFNKLALEITSKLKGDQSDNTPAIDALLEMLFSENEDEQAFALGYMAFHNLRPHVEQIKNRIESWSIEENLKKTYLFELLAEQEISIEINFGSKKVNPTKDSLFLNDQVQETLVTITELVHQEPQILEAALGEARRFFMITYPAMPSEGKILAKQLVNVVRQMFGQEVELTDKEKQLFEIIK